MLTRNFDTAPDTNTLFTDEIKSTGELVQVWRAPTFDDACPFIVIVGVGAGTVRIPESDFKGILENLYNLYFSGSAV